ncbi:Hpt domain-containing protein [Gayadomonas joobiniege]|uniref:Hpt domain-containing protein n=1 Tax=Gayadomonas joobiniege TaxID=1234606 RepID=UPI0012DCFE25|nr:Hpt domain-containing protein [Gayadomonas joobiniege]
MQTFNGQKILFIEAQIGQNDDLINTLIEQGLTVIDAAFQNQLNKLFGLHRFDLILLNSQSECRIGELNTTNIPVIEFSSELSAKQLLALIQAELDQSEDADGWQDEDYLIAPDSELFKSLQADYINSLLRDKQQLIACFWQQDWHQIELIAHKIKGSAGNFGLQTIGRTAQALNAALKLKQQDTAQHYYYELINALAQLQVAK